MPEPLSNNPFREEFGLPGLPEVEGPQEGFWGAVEYLGRPAYALSEAVQAGAAGEGIEGILSGIGRGLLGQRKFGTLGEKFFPEAQKPGFQPEDIPAFALDFVADPLLLLGPSALKVALKPLAKGAIAIGGKLTPQVQQVLKAFPEAERILSARQKAALVGAELRSLNMTPMEAIRRVLNGVPDEALPKILQDDHYLGVAKYRDVYKGTPLKEVPETAREGVRIARAFERTVSKGAKLSAEAALGRLAPDQLDMIRAGLRSVDANFRPVAKTALQALTQEFATRWAPAGAALKYFGGQSGKRLALSYNTASQRARIREAQYLTRLTDIFRGAKEDDLLRAVATMEGKAPAGSPQVQRLADDMSNLLDDHWDDLTSTQNLDPFGQMIQVVDPKDGTATDLINHKLSNYFPHKYPVEWYTKGGQRTLRKKLLAQNWDATKVDEFIAHNLSYKPTKIGHIELTRTTDDLMYEKDPRKVLPQYIADSIWRQELAKEFGVGGEILDDLAGDLKNMDIRTEWVDRLVQSINGRDHYDSAMANAAMALTGFQAITKLGFSTSVANTAQGPLNQIIRNGFKNYAQSLWRGGLPSPVSPNIVGGTHKGMKTLGMAAYNRRMQEELGNWATGKGRSWFADRYMKMVGFDYSERVGRHVGAVGGSLDAEHLMTQWDQAIKAGKTSVADRAASELARKYDITPEIIRASLQNPDIKEDLLTRAGIMGSDAVMHAFDVMDLPLGWRDPLWRTILQFKSFGYKQLEFMGKEVIQPALQYYATGGARGTIGPLLRSAAMFPPMAMGVSHLRDYAKAIPNEILWGEWDYKDPYWEDPDPGTRFWTDMMYVGTLGLMGDVIEQAEQGHLADWLIGPTGSEAAKVLTELKQGRFEPGKAITRVVPGAAALNRGRNIVEKGELPFAHFFEE